jgi:glycosyltransferase involved in cell wall biosynthesis
MELAKARMKILFDHHSPFLLAHGGFQHQILETKNALEARGLDVQFMRWWEEREQVDLIHFFGLPSSAYLQRARAKGIPVVATVLLTATCNRPKARLKLQGLIVRTALQFPILNRLTHHLPWQSFKEVDCIVVGLEAEQYVMRNVYGVSDDRIAIVPLGVSDAYLKSPMASRDGDYLITTGTITDRKRSIELAQMAHLARVPLLFVGRPYEEDAYWRRFASLIDGQWVRHHPHVESAVEMIPLLNKARGFTIYSRFENWCLSAHEAAALGLPLLLPRQPWALERFGNNASYLDEASIQTDAKLLKAFYDGCGQMPVNRTPLPGWDLTAERLHAIYERVRRDFH